MTTRFRLILAACLSQGAAAFAQERYAELAKKLSNPVASLISVPFQSNFDFGMGPSKEGWKYTLKFRPVIPISLGKDWNLITPTFGIVVSQAAEVSDSAKHWLATQQVSPESLPGKFAANQHLKFLLPYQDKLIEKGHELAAKAGTWMAEALAAGAQGTGTFLLLLFVILYATFYFLTDGRAILDQSLRYTPLSDEDRLRLRRTVSSVSRATLKGKLIIGIVQGGLAGLSFWAAGIQGVMLIGKDTDMPDLLVLLATLGGLAVFGFSGILVGPIVAAVFLAVWQLWGGAVDEVRGTAATPPIGE